MKHKITNIIDIDHFEVDILTDFHYISFGITIGTNSFTGKRPDNLLIEINCLFWTLSVEFKRFCI